MRYGLIKKVARSRRILARFVGWRKHCFQTTQTVDNKLLSDNMILRVMIIHTTQSAWFYMIIARNAGNAPILV